MKEKVIAILAAHDQLRAHEREDFKAYLTTVFTQAERVPTYALDIAALEEQVHALQSQVASLTERIAVLDAAQANPAAQANSAA